MNMPHMRYVAFSYSEGITTRDNNKMTHDLGRFYG
jgi:hypothetical protein